ncbi:hypothetical protein RR48_11291 [Papilio machaon]|uniref:Pacifastin domain-containing protein n=1 Tax=Papilio machaon TaxID=76193 RepID=A0A194QRX5_PAPMA|nr:hypothetical protein RR48_11291 [Papilio machaon]
MWSLNCVFISATLLNVVFSKNYTDGPVMLRMNKLETRTLSCQPNITYVNGLEACVSNRHLEKLILGKYSFSVCGDMFLKDTIDLIPFTGKLLRLGAKNFEQNNTLEIKYAPVPVPPEYNDVKNEETMNAQRMYVDRSSDSNSIEPEDDDMNLSSFNTGTRMPELDRISSEEHVNIHKQKSEEINSEVDTPVKKKQKKVISNKFENKAEVPSKVGLRNQDTKSGETFYREFNLSDIFKKFLGLHKSPTRRAVSLDSRSACKPGTEIAKDCNMCYCMRNAVAAKLWHERCKKNSHVLNDCNWCWCDDSTYQYRCSARVCGQVDMFGHFNDAIKEINVGMEGKGSWRSTESACVPGAYYRRGTVLCVCNEDGYWPNPVCRDIFRILHSVEVTRGIEVTQKCEPTKLYLLSTFQSSLTPIDDYECQPGTKYSRDCDVCYCEKQNGVTAFSCTIKQCNPKPKMDLVVTDCVEGTIYERNCLICRCDILEVKRETCIVDKRCSKIRGDKEIHTNGLELLYGYCQPLHIYTNNCNICQCAANGKLWKCTTNNCVKPAPIIVDLVPVLPKYPDPCPKGGSYKIDCNVCFCLDNGNAICTTNDCENKENVK